MLDKLIQQAIDAQQQGQVVTAAAIYSKIIAVNPQHAVALNNLGCIYAEQQQAQNAKQCWVEAIAADQSYADPVHNYALVLEKEGNYQQAMIRYQQAIEINPDFIAAHGNYGELAFKVRNFEQATKCFTKIIQLQPENRYAYFKLALIAIYQQPADYQQALQYLEKTISIDDIIHCKSKGLNYFELNSILYILYCKANLCDRNDYAELIAVINFGLPELWNRTPSANKFLDPFICQILNLDPNLQLKNSKCAALKMQENKRATIPLQKHKISNPIRLGFLSSNFYAHPISLIIGDSFKHFTRNKFRIYSYSTSSKHDHFTHNIVANSDEWQQLPHSSPQYIARVIADDQIDILIDLAGFTGDQQMQILSYQPAPIQCHWLGYAGSLQAEYIQYYLADKFLVPEEHKHNFNENILYMPDSFIAMQRLAYPVTTKAQFGIAEDSTVICCFCKSYRLSSEFVYDLCTILKQLENSVAVLYVDNLAVQDNILAVAFQHGIAAHKFVFTNVTNTTNHFAQQFADLFLDTYYLSGATNTLLTLMVDVPVLTYAGTDAVSRVSGSILTACGLEQLVCNSRQEYIDKAIKLLSSDRQQLIEIKNYIRNNKELFKVFNQQHFIQNLEDILQNLVHL